MLANFIAVKQENCICSTSFLHCSRAVLSLSHWHSTYYQSTQIWCRA